MKNKKRIFIGLSEVAGFGTMYTKGLKKLGTDVDFIISKPDLVNRNYPCDRCLNIQKFPKVCRLIILTFELLKAIIKYDYFIFLYGKSFWPGNYDLPVLRFLNKRLIAIFLGCEIRQRDEILKLNRFYSPCQDCTIDCKHKTKKHIAAMFEKYANNIICQPEYAQLLTKKYKYAWVPIDIEEWSPIDKSENHKFKIIHAPSNTQKKGTPYILEAIDRLKREGYDFEFLLAQGIDNNELKYHIQNADLVVDQLMIGWYGKLAVESMAVGTPVICRIDDNINQQVKDLPIIKATPDNIYTTIKYYLDNKHLLKEISFNSRKFVEKHHNYLAICQELFDLFEDDL